MLLFAIILLIILLVINLTYSLYLINKNERYAIAILCGIMISVFGIGLFKLISKYYL